MVPGDPCFPHVTLFCRIWNDGYDGGGPVLSALAWNYTVIRYSNQTKKNHMSIGFFLVGGVIFALYMGLTIWNIVNSNNKQSEDNRSNKN